MKYGKWIIPRGPQEAPRALLEAGCTPLLAAVLARRGIVSAEEAGAFLDAGPESLQPPELMLDMDRAAARVREAIERRETVAVYGDYDVDGITSACLLTSYLRGRGAELPALHTRPHRRGLRPQHRGPGHHNASRGATLLITVDCGITAAAEAEHAPGIGLDLIITDHHECGAARLPAGAGRGGPEAARLPLSQQGPRGRRRGLQAALRRGGRRGGPARRVRRPRGRRHGGGRHAPHGREPLYRPPRPRADGARGRAPGVARAAGGVRRRREAHKRHDRGLHAGAEDKRRRPARQRRASPPGCC